MGVLVVGSVLKDVYLNLDGQQDEKIEIDKNNVKWLDISFDASEHRFFSREPSLGGAAVTLEVFSKMGIQAFVSNYDVVATEDGLVSNSPIEGYRYILVSDGQVSYFVPEKNQKTTFATPTEAFDYIYIDRSAELDAESVSRINAYLDISPQTKLIIYVRNFENVHLNGLLRRASLCFFEKQDDDLAAMRALDSFNVPSDKIVKISSDSLEYKDILEEITVNRIDVLTHLSAYSIMAATVIGGFILGYSVEESLRLARANVENSKLNSVLELDKMKEIANYENSSSGLELIAANMLLKGKGILAADESGGSIKKKFAQLEIPDTYENRRDYRNIFFTTPDLEKYVNGVILFDETARQFADDGRNYVDYLTSKRIIPGIKVDQGLEKYEGSNETYTKGLEDLSERLSEYYMMGLRFAKWRAAFEVNLLETGELLTPSDFAISDNCRILAEYALKCQKAGFVPIVEPEVVYDGYYSIEKCADVTAKILDELFNKLSEYSVNLKACVLKCSMVLAGKKYEVQSTSGEVGLATAKVLKEHVPSDLAGVVFLSGGQTVEQATENLAEIVKNGPYPWPVTFSFARALQDPALYAWAGDNENINAAREAFRARLIANQAALEGTNS